MSKLPFTSTVLFNYFQRSLLTAGIAGFVLIAFDVQPTQARMAGEAMMVPANDDASEPQNTRLDNSYDNATPETKFNKLKAPFAANIQLPTLDNGSAHLIKFSSLTPDLLAFISRDGLTPSTHNFRIIDSQGHVMPMALKPIQKTSLTNHPVQSIAVQTDDPDTTAQLRQLLRIQIQTAASATTAEQNNVDVAINGAPAKKTAKTVKTNTWWLANPVNKMNQVRSQTTQLQLQFGSLNTQRPIQLEVYGSQDMQHWEHLKQAFINPFEKRTNAASALSQQAATNVELNAEQSNYAFWQIVANQPLQLRTVSAKQLSNNPSYFLTQKSFIQRKDEHNQWQLTLSRPMLITGIEFFVPESQLWQVALSIPPEDVALINQIITIDQTSQSQQKSLLANAQVNSINKQLTWQPTILQTLNLSGQMNQDSIPVTLLTPVYALYFLAQGHAPYQLVVNEPKSLAEPLINLTDNQIAQYTDINEGRLDLLLPLDDKNARLNSYKTWGLWAVLITILLALSALAYRLYQQTTTQSRS